jgi:hypothetical protein
LNHIVKKHPVYFQQNPDSMESFKDQISNCVNSLQEFGEIFGFTRVPWNDPIPYIPELEVFEGYGTGDPDNICYSTVRKTVQKKKPAVIVDCLVQKIFSVAPNHGHVAVFKAIQEDNNYSRALKAEEDNLRSLFETQPTSIGEQRLRGLFLDQLVEKYDFFISIPQYDDDEFQIFSVIRNSFKVIDSVAEIQISNLNVAQRKTLGGGQKLFYCLPPKSVDRYSQTMIKLILFLSQANRLNLDLLKDQVDDYLRVTPLELTNIARIIAEVIYEIIQKKEDYLYDFARLLGVKSDGTYLAASIIRSQIPHITYFCRICGLYVLSEGLAATDWINDFDTSSTDSPIRSIQELMAFLDKIGDTTVGSSIYWKSNSLNKVDYQSLQIADVTITLNDLKTGIRKAIDLSRDLMGQLFMALPVPSVDLCYMDDLNSTVPGKWFASTLLINQYKSFVNQKVWSMGFYANGEWKVDMCRNWINKCDNLGALILFISQIVYGQPARATELEKMQLRNECKTRRSVFIIDEKVCFMQGYHKARSVTGKDRFVPRFLDRNTSKLFVIFHVYLRQWQQ